MGYKESATEFFRKRDHYRTTPLTDRTFLSYSTYFVINKVFELHKERLDFGKQCDCDSCYTYIIGTCITIDYKTVEKLSSTYFATLHDKFGRHLVELIFKEFEENFDVEKLVMQVAFLKIPKTTFKTIPVAYSDLKIK